MKKILLSFSLLLVVNFLKAQNFDLNIGSIQTELKQGALNYGIKYAKDLIDSNNKQINFKKGFLVLLPEFNSSDGSKDAFSAITTKVTGFLTYFKTTNVAGIPVPDLHRTFSVLPFSLGAETNSDFSFINGIAEIGYFPWYWQPKSKVPEILKYSKTAIFLQAGYKFKTDTTVLNTGGKQDESNEPIDKGFFRSKLIFEIDTKNLLTTKKSGFGIGLVGAATQWYDFTNHEFYYKVEGKTRIYINANYHFDLKYERGSGAPNFNKGDQFGASLGISF